MENNFKVVFIPQIGGDCEYQSYHEDMGEAVSVLSAIADYTLILHECSLMPDHSNSGMLYKDVAGEWVEIDDDGIEI